MTKYAFLPNVLAQDDKNHIVYLNSGVSDPSQAYSVVDENTLNALLESDMVEWYECEMFCLFRQTSHQKGGEIGWRLTREETDIAEPCPFSARKNC